MSAQPALDKLARRAHLVVQTESRETMSDTERTLLMRAAEWQLARRTTGRRWPLRVVAIGGASAAVMATGVAYAAWTADGSGVAAATAGTASGVNGSVTTVSTTGGTLLTPGNTVPAVVNIHNPNTFAVVVSAVSLTAASQPAAVSGASGCNAANSGVSLLAASAPSLSKSIPAGGDATVNVPGAISMTTGSDNSCQGATFTFSTSNATVTAASQ